MNYYFIVNPSSQTGNGKKIFRQQLLPYLKKHPTRWKLFYTHYKGHCADMVRRLTTAPKTPRTIVILGGDGTLNEAINGMVSFENVTLAYIPIGSSNDFARGLGIKGSPKKQLKRILGRTHEVWLDCGVVKAPGKEPRRFMVSSGMGYDAAVTHEALGSPIKNVLNAIHLGRLTYVLIALKQMLRLKLHPMAMTLDRGLPLIHPRMYFTSIHNLPFEGGGFKFTPKAVPADGCLDICAVSNIPKLKALALLPTAFAGKHVHFKGVNIHRCRHIHLACDEPLRVHTDGETYGCEREIHLWCEPGKIHFVY